MENTPASNHIAAARTRLSHLSGVAARTDATERRILDAAEERIGTVQADIEKLRPRVHTDAEAAQQYQALTLELGQIQVVAARARQEIGG